MRLLNSRTAISTLALGLTALAVACGSDTPAAESTSQPTPPVDLASLSAEQVLERASQTIEDAQSFESEWVRTYINKDGSHVTEEQVRMESPERVYSYSETDDRASEDILFDGVVYSRNADSAEALGSTRWQSSDSRQRSNEYFNATDILGKLENPEVSVDESGERYKLTGMVQGPLRYGGGLSSRTYRLEPGPFTAIIDPVGFTPVSASYEMTEVVTDKDDPEFREEAIITVHVEFRSFNEEITVSEPPADMVDEEIQPTSTSTSAAATPTPTPQALAPTIFPTATPAPMPTVAFTPTPTAAPPQPPGLPTAVPPTPYSEFQEQIDAAVPADVFEVQPGMIVLYEPCGGESDGIVTAKLFDMSNEDQSSGYMALIHIQLSDGTWTAEHPGLTSSVAIKSVEDNPALMDQVVEHADPGSRGC